MGTLSAHVTYIYWANNGVGLDIITAGTMSPFMSVLQFFGHISGGIVCDMYNKKII